MYTYVFIVILTIFNIFAPLGHGHSYHLGNFCPDVKPAPDFEMDKMLGLWYVIQKTSTTSECITYNFTRTPEPDTYLVEQSSQHFFLGLTPLEHHYRYTGILTIPDNSVQGRMTVNFPLSVAGSASYTVFLAEYNKAAAIFTCQKLPLSHRQSTTILSRTKTLDNDYLLKIRSKMTAANVSPFDLSVINQKDCPKADDHNGTDIKIDSETISPKSIGGVVKKVGETLGQGVEYLAEGAKKVYQSVVGNKEDYTGGGDKFRYRPISQNPDAEWLP